MSERIYIAYIWLDDVRPFGGGIHAVHDYDCYIAHSVNEAKDLITICENERTRFIIDIDHDLGDYAKDGGDGYKLVEWLIETGRNTNHYAVQCHSMNPVGKAHILGLRDRYWEPFDEEEFFYGKDI